MAAVAPNYEMSVLARKDETRYSLARTLTKLWYFEEVFLEEEYALRSMEWLIKRPISS